MLSKKIRNRTLTLAVGLTGTYLIGASLSALISSLPVKANDSYTQIIEVYEEKTDLAKPAEPVKAYTPDPYEVELIGRTIWGEAGGVKSEAERAAVAWCILNRVDAYQQSIEEVVTAPMQFQGYRPTGDCPEQHLELAADVLKRWHAEKNGAEEVGRTLPAEYLYFLGDGERNHFSIEFLSAETWGWSLESPYIQ